MSLLSQIVHAPKKESGMLEMCTLLLVLLCQLTEDLVLVGNKLCKCLVGLRFVFLVFMFLGGGHCLLGRLGYFLFVLLLFLEVVTTAACSGDGDRLCFFLCFFLGSVACVMNSSASSSSSLSTLITCLLFLATDGPLSGLLFFFALLFDCSLSSDKSSSSSRGLG